MESDTYYLQNHENEFEKHDDGFRPVFVMNSVASNLPEKIEIDAYGWGPFKSLVIRR
nr:hypothetical protein [Candidatus Sigynarchaeota archaeon]